MSRTVPRLRRTKPVRRMTRPASPIGMDDEKRLRDELDRGMSLPASWYTYPALAAREDDRILRRGWQYVRRAEQVPAWATSSPGSSRRCPITILDPWPRANRTCRSMSGSPRGRSARGGSRSTGSGGRAGGVATGDDRVQSPGERGVRSPHRFRPARPPGRAARPRTLPDPERAPDRPLPAARAGCPRMRARAAWTRSTRR